MICLLKYWFYVQDDASWPRIINIYNLLDEMIGFHDAIILCVYIYVCVCICVSLYIYMYIYIYTHAYMHIYVCMRVYVYAYVCARPCLCIDKVVSQRYEWNIMTSSNETYVALLPLCEGYTPVTGGFPSRRPVTRSLDVLFDLRH